MKPLAGVQSVHLRLSFILVLFKSLWLVFAGSFRHYDSQVDVASAHSITEHSGRGVNSSSCTLANTVADSMVRRTATLGTWYTKLRVCNAATTQRTAVINVWLNGKKLNTDDIQERSCEEFVVLVTKRNEFEVKLSGQVISKWSADKSEEEMRHTPIMFLVAYVFGHGDGMIFTVNEFHGEDNGLNSVQVAYMDIFRGAPAAKLQLVSPGGSFQIEGGTFVHVCGGVYSLQFVREGEELPAASNARLVATPGEQYVVMRLAPDGASFYTAPGKASETVIVFPDASGGKPGFAVSRLLAFLLCAFVVSQI
mmetsp:Transcript_6438/g.10302  ORF Transcript_6438/g.10302 Transcript_6438/m.10302 type:complete len:309 (-) Transcript_6438:48-974(-)